MSNVEAPDFHVFHQNYQRLRISQLYKDRRVPWSIFTLTERLSGTLYTVVKHDGEFIKIYEDGSVAYRVRIRSSDPDSRERFMRRDYQRSGEYTLGPPRP